MRSSGRRGHLDVVGMSPGAAVLVTSGWARLHGMVMLELLGHVPWVGGAGEQMMRVVRAEYADQVRAAR